MTTAVKRPLLRPQGLMAQAAHDTRRLAQQARGAREAPSPPADPARWRDRMVQRLEADGRGCEAVWRAMRLVPRHRFVDPGLAAQAYEDTALPIGHGQTISSPSVVAHMIALLLQGETAQRTMRLGDALEIGSGCGYQAALLAQLARRVVSIERLAALFARAQQNLALLPLGNVRLVHGDGRHGHPPNAPYQSIIAAAGGDELPPAWLAQLAPGGRLVAPIGGTREGTQSLLIVDMTPAGPRRRIAEAVHFVPLRAGLA